MVRTGAFTENFLQPVTVALFDDAWHRHRLTVGPLLLVGLALGIAVLFYVFRKKLRRLTNERLSISCQL